LSIRLAVVKCTVFQAGTSKALGQHRLAYAVGPNENDVEPLLDEVEGEQWVNKLAVDAVGPVEVIVRNGLEPP
jgi:hypothetical protein